MAKYVDDGFLTALVVRARGFCTGEFHSQINPEIAQAYLDAAEALEPVQNLLKMKRIKARENI